MIINSFIDPDDHREPKPNLSCQDLFMLKHPSKFDMKGHKAAVTWLSFHPAFTQIATASEDGTIKLW